MKQGVFPHAITVVGRPIQITGVEPSTRSFIYADIHPVVYIYSFEEQNETKEKAAQVTTLGELARWLDNERADRRFWIVSLIVGVLSLIVVERRESQANLPPGWDTERIRKVLAHYEEQTEDEAVAEDEAAFERQDQTFMEIPNELVPLVRELIAQHQTRT